MQEDEAGQDHMKNARYLSRSFLPMAFMDRTEKTAWLS